MDAFLDAGAFLLTPMYWGALVVGVLLSIVVGMVPGVGSLLVMALLLPFLLIQVEDPALAIVLLAAITGCNNTLDSIPAVLVGLPGGSTQVTFLEGHQLARRGEGAYTLGAVYAVSAIGGIVGAIALAIVIPVIKPFVLTFSYSEIAVMALFGVAMVAVLSRGAMIKGLIGAMFGIILGTVGTDRFTGTLRFGFDRVEMWGGLPVIATLLGIFALPELIDLTMTRKGVAPTGSNVSRREVLRGAREGLKRWRVAIRQSLYGVFLGAIPGVGAGVIDWLAYALGVVLHKGDRSQFGHGSLDGVLFAEAAQNAKEAGQAVPTLAIGVPGGTGWIIILVAMMAYGITPGPRMLDTYAHITMLIVLTLALGNLVVTLIGLAGTNYLAQLTKIPYPIIGFTIIPMAMLAGFTDMLSWFAIPIILVFTVVGLTMKRYGWPRPPLVLGFILGPIIERNLQTALGFHGAVGIMTRPLTIVLFILVIVFTTVILRASARSERLVESTPTAGPTPASGGSVDNGPKRWFFNWRQEQNWVPIAAVLAAGAFMIAATEYPLRARMLPMWLGIGIIALSVVQLLSQAVRRGSPAEIMDIGMRSRGMRGAGTAGLLIAGMLAMFVFLSTIIGLKYSAMVFALIGPMLLLEGRLRWIGGLISAFVVFMFAFVLMDQIMNVIWPRPALCVALFDVSTCRIFTGN